MDQPGMEERLWNFIDGHCSPVEKTSIEQLLAENAAWKAKYEELTEFSRMIGEAELDEPSLRFTKNVMEEIAKQQIAPAARNYINSRIIWGLGLFFLVVLIGFLVYGFGQVNLSASGSGTQLPVDLSKVDYSKFFNNTYMNVLMMVNVVLGLFLFDYYLSSKRKKFRQDY